MKVFAENYRGFRKIDIDLSQVAFLVGDNSSGKSSILHLIDAVSRSDLDRPPSFDDQFAVDSYDYFSPYFNFSDVTFGFSNGLSQKTAKILTVRKRKSDTPRAIRCSYFYNGHLITFIKSGSTIKYRLISGIENSDSHELCRLHNDELIKPDFKTSKYKSSRQLGENSLLYLAIDLKEFPLVDLIPHMMAQSVTITRYISPIRAFPEKFYPFKRKISAHGTHFPTMWMDLVENKTEDMFVDVRKFGQDSGLFDDIDVKSVSDAVEDSPVIVTVKRSGKEFLLNQVGIGVSQVIPVLIDSVFSNRLDKSFLLIQQPELHLHPVAQAALGSYLYTACSNGLRGIFETHSSYLIDRFRSDLRDSYVPSNATSKKRKLAATRFEIIFCQAEQDGNKITRIKIDRKGRLIGDPPIYHKFFLDELMRTIF